MSGHYTNYFQRAFDMEDGKADPFFVDEVQPLIAAILATPNPFTVAELREIMSGVVPSLHGLGNGGVGNEEEHFEDIMASLSGFLERNASDGDGASKDKDRVKLFHQSLVDWLVDTDSSKTPRRYAITEARKRRGHAAIAVWGLRKLLLVGHDLLALGRRKDSRSAWRSTYDGMKLPKPEPCSWDRACKGEEWSTKRMG